MWCHTQLLLLLSQVSTFLKNQSHVQNLDLRFEWSKKRFLSNGGEWKMVSFKPKKDPTVGTQKKHGCFESPSTLGFWDPFQMANSSWLIHGGDPNYFLNGMILQVGILFIPKQLTVQVLHAVFVCWHCLGCCYKPPWPPSNDPIYDPWPAVRVGQEFFCWRVHLQSKPLQGTNMSPTVWKRKNINGWHIFPKVVYGRIQAATLFSEKLYCM